MAYQATQIRLELETRATLEGWVRASKSEQRMVKRARIVLLAADGMASRAIAREAGVTPGIASMWRTRFATSGIDGLKDKPRPGAKPVYTEETGKRILAVLDQPVPEGRARWTAKLAAEELGDVDINDVRRFLRIRSISLGGNHGVKVTIQNLQPKPPMSLAFICRRPKTPSFCVLMKSHHFRRLNARRAISSFPMGAL